MKEKNHTVGIIPKSNRIIVETNEKVTIIWYDVSGQYTARSNIGKNHKNDHLLLDNEIT
jgi:hypothetical protein